MPTRISAGIGEHPCFLTFITMNPIDCKLLIFPYARRGINYLKSIIFCVADVMDYGINRAFMKKCNTSGSCRD